MQMESLLEELQEVARQSLSSNGEQVLQKGKLLSCWFLKSLDSTNIGSFLLPFGQQVAIFILVCLMVKI